MNRNEDDNFATFTVETGHEDGGIMTVDAKPADETVDAEVESLKDFRLDDGLACGSNVSREHKDVPAVEMTIDSICSSINTMCEHMGKDWGNLLFDASSEIKSVIASTPFAELIAASVKHCVPLFIFERVLSGERCKEKRFNASLGYSGYGVDEIQDDGECYFVLGCGFGDRKRFAELLNAGYESLRLGK